MGPRKGNFNRERTSTGIDDHSKLLSFNEFNGSFRRINGDEVVIHRDEPERYRRRALIEKDTIRSPS